MTPAKLIEVFRELNRQRRHLVQCRTRQRATIQRLRIENQELRAARGRK